MNNKLICVFIFLLLSYFNLPAQQEDKSFVIEGTVYDEEENPFEGVTIYLKDKVTLGTGTGSDGKFSIRTSRGNTLVFSFVGYGKVEYLVTEEKKDVEIRLGPDEAQLDEIVVVGLGTQRKISSVAAVSTIDIKELQTPAPSIANMLGGRMAGIITTQVSGEPGKNIADFWIRGIGTFGANDKALVLIDGLEGDLNSIDPADVESFSILKDASATAVYGVRGANGVVLVTTKRGEEGKLQITLRSNYSLSYITRLPEYLRAYDYAKLMNEAYEVRGEKPRYSDIQLDVIKYGLDPDLYPDVSWQDEILKRASFRHSQFASARGGGSIARYYVSLGLTSETAAYKTEKDNPYASNTAYNRYSFRSNLDMNLTKSSVMYFGVDVFSSDNKRPGQANTDYIWEAQARITPLLFPTMYSNGLLPSYGANNLMSPYVLINHTGKSSDQSNSTMLTLALNQDLEMITEGLTFRVQGAYNRSGSFYEARFTTPAIYRAVGRNSKGDLLTQLQQDESKVAYSSSESAYRKYHLEGALNYNRVFGNKHRVGGLVYYYMSDEKTTGKMSSLDAIPVRYQGVSSRITYGYRDTYMIDVNFGYTGSENFIPGEQYGFFPSIAAGWVPSSHQWVKDNLKWISFFKIRGSYGTVGNDRIGGARFPYLTRVTADPGKNPWGSGGVETVHVSRVGADNLRWEKAIKSNLGIDANFLDSRISLTVDIFNDQRDGIFQERVQIPNYVGLINMPYGNVGKMRSWGSDGNISFTQKIAKDMSVTVRANYTYSQNLVQNWEKVNEKYPYQELNGFPHNIVRGYQSLGFFKDEDDIRYSPKQSFGEVMPGDLKYKDINGDGIVDPEDRVPLSFNSMFPLVMYGIGGEFSYKNFSVGVLLRGTAKMEYYRTDNESGMGYIPFSGEEIGNVLVQFRDPATRWIPKDYITAHGMDPSLAENPNALIPRLSYGPNSNNSQVSDFWKGEARYLRLQEITLNYSLSRAFLRKIGISSVALQLVANNIYVWDKVKIFDPEQANKNGQAYPIPAVYSFQIYINM
jgi:TonB-linked SusC/RagA family outer membrane protein